MDKNNQNQFEVEVRGPLTKDQFEQLNSFLGNNAQVLGADDRENIFFIIPDKTLKVSKYLSKDKAKIALKLGNIKTGEQEEIEFPIDIKDAGLAVKTFEGLGFTEIQITTQKRNNYLYKGIEIAVKYSDDWNYHYEMEIVVDSKNKVDEARKSLGQISKELGLKIFSEQEIANICEAIDAKYRDKNKLTSLK